MTKIQRLHLSKTNWLKMIEQADKFIKSKKPWHNVDYARDLMEEAIGINWTIDYDPLCQRYFRKDCAGCPLRKIKQSCGHKDSAFMKCENSKSWQEFKTNAKKYMIPAFDLAIKYCMIIKKRKRTNDELNSIKKLKLTHNDKSQRKEMYDRQGH